MTACSAIEGADPCPLICVHRGTGELFRDYGHLSIRAGDDILLPRSTM